MKNKEGGISIFKVIFIFMLMNSIVSRAKVMHHFKVRGADGKNTLAYSVNSSQCS